MSDTFRKTYKKLTDENSALIVKAKEKAEELEYMMQHVKSREMSLALINLEQAMMWCTKAIALDDEKNNS